jgi:DnaJ domain
VITVPSVDKNPYDVLGVPRGAAFDDVKAAYRRRSQLLHPDHHSSASDAVKAEAATMMALLNNAYEALRSENGSEDRTHATAPRAGEDATRTKHPSGVRVRCPRCHRISVLGATGAEVVCVCGARLRLRQPASAKRDQSADTASDNTDPDDPQSPEDAIDDICGDLLAEGDALGRPLRDKHLLDLATPESALSARKKDRLILAVEPTLLAVREHLLANEPAVTMHDGAILPESWAAAYALLDLLEDPPAILAIIEAVLRIE